MEKWSNGLIFQSPHCSYTVKLLSSLSQTSLYIAHGDSFSFLLLFLANTNIFEFFRLLVFWSWTEKETNHKHRLSYKAPCYCNTVLTFKTDALVSVFNGSFDSVGIENLFPCILAYRLNPRWGIGGLQTDLLGIQGCQVVGSLVRITQSVKNVMPQPIANEVP